MILLRGGGSTEGVAVFDPDPVADEVVVATEVRHGSAVLPCASAGLLMGALRRAGLPARCAPVITGAVPDAFRADLPRAWVRGVDAAVMRRVLVDWLDALALRRVLLAEPRSFCAGVERAVEIVERALQTRGSPVYVRKQIVHNAHVVRELELRGAVFVDELDQVPHEATVVFSAHGVSPAVRAEAARRGLDVIDATCPLVTKVHAEARRFADRGNTILLIGHADHEETEGTLGEAPDRTVVVETVDAAASLEVPDPARVAYLMQTTLAVDEATSVAAAIKERFPAARGPGSDDICYATTNRQRSLRAVAAESDLVLVVGSANSSNSVRLVEIAERIGTPAHLVDDVTDVDLRWLAGIGAVGVTAGASAPAALVRGLVDNLAGLGPVTVTERRTATETVSFTLPKELRS